MWVHGYPMADTAESVAMRGVFAADQVIERKLDEGSLNTMWKFLSRYVSFGLWI